MKPDKKSCAFVAIPVFMPVLGVFLPPTGGHHKKNSTGPATQEYRSNWARIFGNEKPMYQG